MPQCLSLHGRITVVLFFIFSSYFVIFLFYNEHYYQKKYLKCCLCCVWGLGEFRVTKQKPNQVGRSHGKPFQFHVRTNEVPARAHDFQ